MQPYLTGGRERACDDRSRRFDSNRGRSAAGAANVGCANRHSVGSGSGRSASDGAGAGVNS
jgi:hypothetical protein